MFELKPAIEESPWKLAVRRTLQSLPAVCLGLVFVLIGLTKFTNDPQSEWYRVFEQIGIGQWFRVLTGIVQVGGGAMMCVRRTRTAGAALLAATMLGAAAVDIFIMGSPMVLAPLLLLIAIATIWAVGS